jgi:hypothetical protein
MAPACRSEEAGEVVTDCTKCRGLGSYSVRSAEVRDEYKFPWTILRCDCGVPAKSWWDDTPGAILGVSYHEESVMEMPDGTLIHADLGIQDDLRLLWAYGIKTYWSCEGGGADPVGVSGRYISLGGGLAAVRMAQGLLDWVRRIELGRAASDSWVIRAQKLGTVSEHPPAGRTIEDVLLP